MATQTNASCPHGEPRPRVNIRKTLHNRHMTTTSSPQERPRAHSEQSIYIPVPMCHLIPGGDWQRQQVLQRDPTLQAPCLWLERVLCTAESSPHCWRHCLPSCGYLLSTSVLPPVLSGTVPWMECCKDQLGLWLVSCTVHLLELGFYNE